MKAYLILNIIATAIYITCHAIWLGINKYPAHLDTVNSPVTLLGRMAVHAFWMWWTIYLLVHYCE